ncbi:MAG: hypothetical protein ACJ75Q_06200 [Gaiellaceae bacterium]
MAVKQISLSLGLPFGLGSMSGTWEPDEQEQKAAWEMYVELITRTSIEPQAADGSLGEALSSLYTLFGTTREILRKYGPAVAKPKGGDLSFGLIAVTVLNKVLRPLLTRWHPELADYESHRPPEVSPIAHERAWPRSAELRAALNEVRGSLRTYAGYLAEVADVPPLADEGRA